MSETNWTPSPWQVDDSAEEAPYCVAARDPKDDCLFELCSIWGEDDDTEPTPMAEANANLIAASPDLYEALENLLALARGEGGTKPDAHGLARAALAKARGETQ